MRNRIGSKALAAYEIAVGAAIAVYGVTQRAWWTSTVGALLLASGIAIAVGRGEATSWVRGDLDERRQRAVDHAFRIAFLALAWWIAGCAIVADRAPVPVAGWTAGVAVALVAAYVDYAAVLRRT